jgi:hypothetical protein
MRCMSCEADIPPQWVNAIQSNQCPGCGGEIMNQPAKELLDELTKAIERMPNNPQGIAGWLLSNYHFRKIGDASPTEHFHTKRGMRQGGPDDVDTSGLRVANNPVQALLKRTDAYRNIQATRAKLRGVGGDKQQQLAAMAAGIAEVDADLYGDGLPDVEAGEQAGEQYFDEDDQVVIERGPRLSRQLATGASLLDATAQPLTPEELAALASSVQPGEEEDDVGVANRVLQAQRLKRLKAQQDVAGGGGIGVFRRHG